MYAFSIVEGSNIPHGSVNSLEDLLVDQQLVATDFWTEFDHPTEGRIRMPAIATRFSRTVPEIRRLQPRLGEHSVEVLGEAGVLAPGDRRTHSAWRHTRRPDRVIGSSSRHLTP